MPGAILLDYQIPTTYASSHSLEFLSEFQLYRRVHGIIGVLDSTESSSNLSDAVSTFHSALKDLPATTAVKAIAFDASDGQMEEVKRVGDKEGLVAVPRSAEPELHLKRILAEFCSSILREFSNLVRPLTNVNWRHG